MKKFRVIHYKSGIDGKIVDNAIGIWTKIINLWDWKTWFLPAYSHDEIWVPDERSGFMTHPLIADSTGCRKCIIRYHGTCYTSTMGQIRGKKTNSLPRLVGTRKLLASVVLKHPERWDYTEFEISDTAFEYAMQWMEEQVRNNKGYAKRDIVKFFPIIRHLVKQDPLRNICSEFVHNACVKFDIFGIIHKFKVISPLRLARKMPWIRNLVTGKLVKGK